MFTNGALNKSGKVYSILEYTSFLNAFFATLPTTVFSNLIYCKYNSVVHEGIQKFSDWVDNETTINTIWEVT